MAYQVDPVSGDIIIGGFEKGIGDSQYDGLTDMKSVNPDTIKGEVGVSFGTKSLILAPAVSGQAGSISAGFNGFLAPTSLKLEERQWIVFNTIATGGTGLSTNTAYFLFGAGTSSNNTIYNLYTPNNTAVTITGDSNVTFSTINPGVVKYFSKSLGNNWMIDSNGRVWSDRLLTLGVGTIVTTNSWTYMGNFTDSSSNGNGMTIYQTVTNGTGAIGSNTGVDEWIFVWRNSQIDYAKITANGTNVNPIVWVNGWKPNTGTTAQTQYLQTNATTNFSHQAIVAPDNSVTYCDSSFVGHFYQLAPASPASSYVGFDPTNTATYFFNIYPILPANDTAQCLTFVNQYILIGGKQNIVYPWDMVSNHYAAPLIQLPSTNIQAMVTVGNNAYIFAGNRGIIYITNGSQASFWKKIPDHISGTSEPLISWGGSQAASAPTQTAAFNKDRLYFGFQASFQAGGNATNYGGLWAVNVNTGAMWNVGQMSYGTYAGFVSAMMISSAQSSYGPNIGYGLISGWGDGQNNFGIDASIAAPYSGGQSIIISDAIPIGTLLQPNTPLQFEYKLATPLLTGETVETQVAPYYGGTFTSLGTTAGLTSSTILSDIFPNQTQEFQWLLVKTILSSGTSGTPSYNRLTQIRVKTEKPFGAR